MQHQPAEPAHLAPHCFLEHPGQAFHQAEPVAGAGDTGVHQLLGQHRVQRVRQDQRGMGELRTLRLVHGHGEHGVHLDQAARQDEAHAAATVVAREGHAQREAQAAVVVALGQAQGDADIAVHQPQAVVVARHQYRPPLVPAVIGLDQAKAQQFCRYPLVQSFHAPWAAAQRAEQAEGVESRQYRLRPALPGAILQRQSGGRAALGQALQVVPVAVRRARRLRMTVDEQPGEGCIALPAQAQVEEVGGRTVQQRARVAGLLPVDQPRQAPDPAARAEAPGMPQHDGLLRQRMRLRRTFAQALPGFAADPLQPGAGLGAVPALLGIPAEIAEHRAGLYRGQLVLVAEQDQARLRR